MQQTTQHFPMIMHSGGSQMSQCIGEVGVDPLGIEIAGQPRESFDKDFQLFQISGAASHAVVVEAGKVKQRHGDPLPGEQSTFSTAHGWSPSQNRYFRNFRAASSVVYLPILVAFGLRVFPILRATYLALLAAFLWAHRWELCLGLLVAGQFGEALKEFRPRTG